ncbi:MAG: hypothetical protein JW913_10030 [Chitinispirillaceae bacterium]|nr:hypothetical protein [Chitinispirillaceae bacterium]
MQNVIFSTASDSIIVAHVIHAGPVTAYTPQNRKSENTHYFRLTTTHGAAFCHFKNEDSARKARGLLGAMLGTVKPHQFRSKGDSIDITSIVSFGRPVKLKKEENEENEKYGLPVNVVTMNEKSATVWLTFQTEESARNVRKALYAAVMSYYSPADKPTAAAPAEAEENSEVQAEVAYTEV